MNLWGAINCIHAVLPGMVERRSGAIVCLSSDAGRMGEYREAVYSACKAGVIALCKSLARETGRYGLRLNAVCPGLVAPPEDEELSSASMWHQMREIFPPEARERAARAYPLRRTPEAAEIANAVVFLASDAARQHHRPNPERKRRLHDGVGGLKICAYPGKNLACDCNLFARKYSAES